MDDRVGFVKVNGSLCERLLAGRPRGSVLLLSSGPSLSCQWLQDHEEDVF